VSERRLSSVCRPMIFSIDIMKKSMMYFLISRRTDGNDAMFVMCSKRSLEILLHDEEDKEGRKNHPRDDNMIHDYTPPDYNLWVTVHCSFNVKIEPSISQIACIRPSSIRYCYPQQH
jgi:hypothetical protein